MRQFTVSWTDDAINSFNENLDYLNLDWPVSVTIEFIDRVDEVIEIISTNPYLFPLHRPKDKIRKCVVHPRVILYFRIIDSESIDLLLFWSTWQNPERMKF